MIAQSIIWNLIHRTESIDSASRSVEACCTQEPRGHKHLSFESALQNVKHGEWNIEQGGVLQTVGSGFWSLTLRIWSMGHQAFGRVGEVWSI